MVDGQISGISEKNSVADYPYFKNGSTQWCHIFRNNKDNFHLVMCKISTSYVKGTSSCELEKNYGSNGIEDYKMTLTKNIIFYHPSPFWSIIPHVFITLVTFDIIMELKLHTHLDESCIYHVTK